MFGRGQALKRQIRDERGRGGGADPGDTRQEPQLRADPRVCPSEGGEFLLNPRDLRGAGREHRRLQVAHQLVARGVAGRVLSVAELLDLREERLAGRHQHVEALVVFGDRTPRMERMGCAEPGDALGIELVGLGARPMPASPGGSGPGSVGCTRTRCARRRAGRSRVAASTSPSPRGRHAHLAPSFRATARRWQFPRPCSRSGAAHRRVRRQTTVRKCRCPRRGRPTPPWPWSLLPSVMCPPCVPWGAPFQRSTPCAHGRTAPQRPPLSIQAHRPSDPHGRPCLQSSSGLGYRSASVAGKRGCGASSPAPGVTGHPVPQRQNQAAHPLPVRERACALSQDTTAEPRASSRQVVSHA